MESPLMDCSISLNSLGSPDSSFSSSSDNSFVSGCKKRKMSTPRRTSPLNDPNFRGVTVFMDNQFINNEWRLVLKSKFQLSPRRRNKVSSYIESSDEDEPLPAPVTYTYPHEGEKHCASCNAVKTPLWRDAEDGTPLCNACGIRYKKYKLRCGMCWHIPKKDEFSPRCRSCGSFYQYVSPRR